MIPQLHLEPVTNKNGFGTLAEYIEVHTYDTAENDHCYMTVHGSNLDDHSQTVELLLPEGEVVALRDALNEVLGGSVTLERGWCHGWAHPNGSRAEHPPHIWNWNRDDRKERYCSGQPDQEEE